MYGLYRADKDYSDQTARIVDEEIRRIVDSAYDECNRLIERHWDEVVAVAESLLRYETISAGDVEKLMKGERISKPTVAELLASETADPPSPSSSQPPSEDTDEDLGGMLPSPA